MCRFALHYYYLLLSLFHFLNFSLTEAGTTCTEWDVRLMGGSSSDGRVEICRTNTWTTVDAVGWDYNDAMVVCRQRGFNDTCKEIEMMLTVFG